jgi:serine/threonine protein kinase
MANPAFPPVPDRFTIVQKIGQGGMGVVYEAVDRDRGTRVALKTLPNMQPVALYRFKHEFRTLATLAHRSLVPLYELISDGTTWFFTMELVEGVDFLEYVRRPPSNAAPDHDPTGELPVAHGVDVTRLRAALRELAEGVMRLHEAGVLHRDLKPSNVLIRPDGRVTILDFGLVKEIAEPAAAESHLAATTDARTVQQPRADDFGTLSAGPHLVGSVPYMAPEQAAGIRLTEAADWYAVGVMLYEALSGRRPFLGEASAVLMAKLTRDVPPLVDRGLDIPQDLEDLCLALLRREPAARPSGTDVLARLASPDGTGVSARRQVSRSMPFVGRGPQLARLHEAFGRMADGKAVTVHVRGQSGAGKSSLVQRFIAEAERETTPIVLSGRCYEQESVPYKALDSLVDALCRYLVRIPHVEARVYMPRDVASLARVFPVLQQVSAVREAMAGRPDVPDVQEVRRRAFGALGELLQRLGDRHMVVMHIDDLQWGDVDSAALLTNLLTAADPPRVLLIASYRSEHAAINPCLVALAEAERRQHAAFEWHAIDVEALSPGESRQLAAQLLGSSADAEHSDRVARESGGNPYFVHELATYARSTHGSLPGADAKTIDLDEVVWARVGQLTKEAQRLLQVVAVAGKPLPVRNAVDAAHLFGAAPRVLGMLRAERLVRSTGPGLDDAVETYHDRIRETVVKRLPGDVVRDHHLRLAQSLESSGSSDIEAIAVHFHRGGDLTRAGHHYAEAGDRAAAALAFERSAELYDLAVTLASHSADSGRSLRVKLADALANAGRGADAAHQYLMACEGAPAGVQRDLRRRAGYQFCISGHIDEGREAFEAVLAHEGMKLPPTRRRALASLLLRRVQIFARGIRFRERPAASIPPEALERVDVTWSIAGGLTMMDPIRGADFQTRNLLQALRLGEPYRVARALAWEATHVAMATSRLRRHAQRLLDAAGALAQRLDHPHALGMTELSRGVAAFFWGDFAACRVHSQAAHAIFREHCTGVAWELDTCRAFGFWALYWLGEFAELAREFDEIVAEARARGARLAEADVTTWGGPFVWLARDDPDGAERAVHAAMATWSRRDFQVQHYTAMCAHAQIAIYRGDGDAAWRVVNDQWAGVASAMLLHVEIVRIYVTHLRARTALAAARHGRDPALLMRAAEDDARSLERERPAYAHALGKLLRAGVAEQRGQTEAAIALLRDAAPALDRLTWGCFGLSARRRLGVLIGGGEGAAIVTDVDERLRAQGVIDPARLSSVQVP